MNGNIESTNRDHQRQQSISTRFLGRVHLPKFAPLPNPIPRFLLRLFEIIFFLPLFFYIFFFVEMQ